MNTAPSTLGRSLPELLTPEEAAAWARVSLSTVSDWIAGPKPDVASFSKGRNRSVLRDSLVEFVWLNTLKPVRPAWVTPALEQEVRKLIRDVVRSELERQQSERLAA
jgi:hypothetical protein